MEKSISEKIKTGLTSEEVKEKTAAGLVNGDLDVKTKSYRQIISDNLFSLFNLVELILFICIAIVGDYRNGLFFLVVFWNFAIGVFQEVRAKKTIEKLSILSAPEVIVLRDGEEKKTAVKDILLGDIMILKSGRQICADCVILDGECEVNESLITGESDPVYKHPGDHLLSGSFVVSGRAVCEVEHIGADNYATKITIGAKYTKKSGSVIMNAVKTVVKVVAAALIPLAALMVWKNFFVLDQPFSEAMIAVVAAVSAMIPGGLILLVSTVMAVSVVRLSHHNTLAQDLYCVENLARVDVLCLDKTGTITEGIMCAEKIIPLRDDFDESLIREFAVNIEDENQTIEAVRRFLGLPEGKVPEAAEKSSISIPFSSKTKWSLLYTEGRGSLIMGAPEILFPDMDAQMKEQIDDFTVKAKRVLVFAVSSEAPDGRELPGSYEAVALIVIGEKIRSTARKTLEYFADENVTLKVISGDNPVTVAGVAAQAGLPGADKYIDASSLKTYEDIEAAAEEYTVFGRVTPYQKLDLVKALRAHGHTVAMTGDGANDVLALKEADCSVAMNSGADAAKNVANMVLMDSDFSSLPFILAEGRKSINNLQRSAGLYLTKTVYAFILSMIFVFMTYTYPFQSIQVTLIGAVTIGIPSFLLALEPNKKRIEGNFLKNVFRMSIPSGILTVIGLMASVSISKYVFGADTAQIQTIASVTLILTGLIVIFDICGRLNRWKGVLMALLLTIAALAIAVIPSFFYFARLTVQMWLTIAAVCTVFFIIHALLFRVLYPYLDKKDRRQK